MVYDLCDFVTRWDSDNLGVICKGWYDCVKTVLSKFSSESQVILNLYGKLYQVSKRNNCTNILIKIVQECPISMYGMHVWNAGECVTGRQTHIPWSALISVGMRILLSEKSYLSCGARSRTPSLNHSVAFCNYLNVNFSLKIIWLWK